ncbi:Bgt-3421 [Blumeria graminis f. sp. tritici]|uniref:5-hydroxyisourate hydrolase n=1 Tax=Blumeria graminis f. sp. tritici TaxID=62690 RepID=A0A9X9L8W3_BLUGR|nr:Bgt-3421 [Blumeria graminis f. sp. tritici]
MATRSKDPITCHVLDTAKGVPGANIDVVLTCLSCPLGSLKAKTNSDGRISNWQKLDVSSRENSRMVDVEYHGATDIFCHVLQKGVDSSSDSVDSEKKYSLWKLEFDTETYFGQGNTFFPTVEVTFQVEAGGLYHVPLLLGPYSYTTYRGS